MDESRADPPPVYRFGPFELDTGRETLTRDGEPVLLRPQSLAVLRILASRAPEVVTKRELFDAVWGGTVVTDDSLVQCIGDIRRALGDEPGRLVRTVPRRGYKVALDGRPVSTTRRSRARWMVAATALTLLAAAGVWLWWSAHVAPVPVGKLSLMVLPFKVVGPAGENEYLADALTDDLITDLSRLPESFVIARGTAFGYKGRAVDARTVRSEVGVRYVVEGSLRRDGERVQVNLQLVDGETGLQRWSDRVEAEGTAIQSFSRTVSGRLARALHLRLVDAEAARAARLARPDAHDLAMRGWSLWDRQTKEANIEARVMLERAIALDPQHAFAWIGLANTHLSDVGGRYTASRAASLDAAEIAVRKAVAIDPNHPNVNGSLGTVLYQRGEIDAAEKAFERQIAMNRNYAPAYFWLGITSWAKGDFPASLARVDEAIALSPRDSRLHMFYAVRARSLLAAGRYAEAVDWSRRSVALRPDYAIGYTILASAAMQGGDAAAARGAAHRATALLPSASITRLRGETVASNPGRPDLVAHWRALADAGLPP